jgi:ribosomal protein S13
MKKKTNLLNFGINKINILNVYKNFGINLKKSYNFINIKKTHYSNIDSFFKKYNIIKGKKLKLFNQKNIEFLIQLKNYTGSRHKLKYPVRGQRTHTNAKTTKKN